MHTLIGAYLYACVHVCVGAFTCQGEIGREFACIYACVSMCIYFHPSIKVDPFT